MIYDQIQCFTLQNNGAFTCVSKIAKSDYNFHYVSLFVYPPGRPHEQLGSH